MLSDHLKVDAYDSITLIQVSTLSVNGSNSGIMLCNVTLVLTDSPLGLRVTFDFLRGAGADDDLELLEVLDELEPVLEVLELDGARARLRFDLDLRSDLDGVLFLGLRASFDFLRGNGSGDLDLLRHLERERSRLRTDLDFRPVMFVRVFVSLLLMLTILVN